MIIDAKNSVLGRMCSHVAKKLLEGENIEIINAEKVIITGRSTSIESEYLQKRQRGDAYKGPFFPRKPDVIIRRTIKGMLPKTSSGRTALKKLRVHIGAPEGKTGQAIGNKEVRTSFMKLEHLCKKLGWRHP